MHLVTEGFFGVFSPSGELEAVEADAGGADFAAENLSPKVGGRPKLNRAVAPVTVIAGSLDDLMVALLARAADTVARRRRGDKVEMAHFDEMLKAEAARDKARLPDDFWHAGHRARMLSDAADRLAEALRT